MMADLLKDEQTLLAVEAVSYQPLSTLGNCLKTVDLRRLCPIVSMSNGARIRMVPSALSSVIESLAPKFSFLNRLWK